MRRVWMVVLFLLSSLSVPAGAQQTMTKGTKEWDDLGKVLRDADLHWICKGPYYRVKAQECIDDRLKFKVDGYFEIDQKGNVLTKEEQAEAQTKDARVHPDVPAGQGANSLEFKLLAVYGNIALATDHAVYKAADPSGKMVVRSEAEALRVFVKENGEWRPAAGSQTVIVPQ